MTQYPLTIFPKELVATLTFVLPLAFVNWYPCLYLLDRDDPFGLPDWVAFASPPWSRWSCSWAGRRSPGAPASATTPRPGS